MKGRPSLTAVLTACVLVVAFVAAGCEGAQKTMQMAATVVEQNPQLIKDQKQREQILAGARAVKNMTTEIDTPEEIGMGQSLSVRAFAGFGKPLSDENVQRYVAEVGKLVAMQSERPSLPYSFAVVQNDEPNALALPGGYVFISTGLLKRLHSESELACILGHEVCHVAQKHGIEIVSRDRVVASLVDFGATLEKDIGKYRQFIDQFYEKLTVEGYDQDYEWKADEAGTLYAYRVGYRPDGLLPFLQASAASGAQMERYKTHPDPGVRISKVRSVLATFGNWNSLPTLDARYRREVLARLP